MVAGVILFFAGFFAGSTLLKFFVFFSASSLIAYVVVTKSNASAEIIKDRLQQQAFPNLFAEEFQAEGADDSAMNVDEESHFRVHRVSPALEDREEPRELDVPQAEASTMMQAERVPQERTIDFQFGDFFDADEESAKEQGPRAEFNYLVKKVLTVIKEVNFAHTVALYWVNRDKKQLVLENFVSESEFFASNRRRELGVDLVSQVAVAGKPQILTNVNAASIQETLPYYEGAEQVKTFVGVPIFYSHTTAKPQEAVAVLTVDCRGEDAYGPETLALLGNFTKLISSLIRSYTDKYDLLLDSEILRSISRFREQMRMDFTSHNVARSLAEETSRLVTWDYVSVILFDHTRGAWVVQYVMNRMNDPYVSLTSEIDSAHSVVGRALQSIEPTVVDRIATAGMPRFYPAERCESNGSLLVVPLHSVLRCYGALVVESKDVSTYAENDGKMLRKLAETASSMLEILGLSDVATNFVATDETTGVATQKYFLARLQEEVQRANDFVTNLTTVLIGVDGISDLTARFGPEGLDAVMQSISRVVRNAVRPYDVVGRYNATTLGVILVQTTANEASLWAEKVRKNVASHIINADGKTFSVTVSIGIATANSETRDVDLLEHADRVLHKAVESNGNIVRVF